MNTSAKREALLVFAEEIQSHKDWWLFPTEGLVQGFMGTGPIFIVGDQPSKSEWPSEHPNRRAFYGLIDKLGVSNAHLTDLYKKRGKCGALKAGLPDDFHEHVRLFRKEIEILQPTQIVALGNLAYKLLLRKVPECKSTLTKVWHFSYATRYGKLSQYGADMHRVLRRPAVPANTVGIAPKPQSQRFCEIVPQVPPGAAKRPCTLRADNNAHYHGIVCLSECPLFLELLCRETSIDPIRRVGIFRLDLAALLRGGYIRSEPAHSNGPDVRLRIVLAGDGGFYVQANQDGPRILLSKESNHGTT